MFACVDFCLLFCNWFSSLLWRFILSYVYTANVTMQCSVQHSFNYRKEEFLFTQWYFIRSAISAHILKICLRNKQVVWENFYIAYNMIFRRLLCSVGLMPLCIFPIDCLIISAFLILIFVLGINMISCFRGWHKEF